MDANEFLARQAAGAREEMPILDGTIKNPVYLDKKGAKNWVAIVTRDMAAPGGLARQFFEHGPKEFAFIPSVLAAGQFLEFGGDKVSAMGSKKVRRKLCEVLEVRDDAIVVRPVKFEDIAAADDGAAPVDAPPAPAIDLSGVPDEAILAEARRRGLV